MPARPTGTRGSTRRRGPNGRGSRTRHEIDYLRGIEPGATGVVARTWVGEPQGPRFNRYVRIEDGQGRVCAQGVTEWVLVDAKTLRPQRIPPEMLGVFEAAV